MAESTILSLAETELYLCVNCGGSKTAVPTTITSRSIIYPARGGPSSFAYLGLANFTAAMKSTVEHTLRTIVTTTNLSAAASDEIIPRRESNIIASTTLPSPNPFLAAAWLGISGVHSTGNVAELTPVFYELLSITAGPRLSKRHAAARIPVASVPGREWRRASPCGNGSIAVSFGRDGDDDDDGLKEWARMGGWEWILGDVEDGGYDVGRKAPRHALYVNMVYPQYTTHHRLIHNFNHQP